MVIVVQAAHGNLHAVISGTNTGKSPIHRLVLASIAFILLVEYSVSMIIDNEFERAFKRTANSFFNIVDVFEDFKESGAEPFYYGHAMTVGPEEKPAAKYYIKPGRLPASGVRIPMMNVVVDEEQTKMAAEMPGAEKTHVKLSTKQDDVSASRGNKKYRRAPIQHKIDENNSAKGSKNGTLKPAFRRAEDQKMQGRVAGAKRPPVPKFSW